ncbi:hypothetical protein MJK72_14070 [Klebsiella pneumoniae]|nr:hypothetical protein MJK72_14070 [Klebsiella pneumoniae]
MLDALLAELGETRTVISPALPVSSRTVYQGISVRRRATAE